MDMGKINAGIYRNHYPIPCLLMIQHICCEYIAMCSVCIWSWYITIQCVWELWFQNCSKFFNLTFICFVFPGEFKPKWWRHQTETFSALLALCAGNSPVTGEFPSQRSVTRSFDVSLICGWVNNREAGDLRRHRAYYDVIVMMKVSKWRGSIHEAVWHRTNTPLRAKFMRPAWGPSGADRTPELCYLGPLAVRKARDLLLQWSYRFKT